VNRHFQAYRAKYSKSHILNITKLIVTKFCTAIKNTKYASWVVQTRVKQIQDGGRPSSWKIYTNSISRQRFDQLVRNLAQWSILARQPI